MDNENCDGRDLRSYEAAVMAGKAPRMLNSRPMKGRGRAGGKLRDERSANSA